MKQSIVCSYKFKKRNNEFNTSLLLMSLYIFFSYTAQKTLFPLAIHSLVMYSWIGWTVLSIVLAKGIINISRYTIWYGSLILLSGTSFIWASHIVTDMLYAMFVSLVITFCFIQTIDTLKKLDYCSRVFVVSADAMGLMIIITGQFTTGLYENRLGEAITGNANSFSAMMMIAAIFASWLLVYKKGILNKLFNACSLAFILIMMMMSSGRKTLIALLACIVFFFIMKEPTDVLKRIGNICKIILILVVLVMVVMNNPILYATIGKRFEEIFILLQGGQSAVSSDNLRMTLVEIGLKQWMNKPIVGYGIDTYKYYNRAVTGHFYYAHNNYVELLYDLGIIGFILYYSCIVKILYRCKKTINICREYKLLGAGLIIMLLLFDFGGISYYMIPMQIVLYLAYLCCNLSDVKKT